MPRQDQRREQTRAALLSQARRLFLRHGYEATTTQMILDESGLSKGALYHHFASKAEMAEAIYAQTSQQAINAAARKSRRTRSPLAALRASALAWLGEIQQPTTARILFELGPQALGWQRAREIENANSLVAMTAALEAAAAAGEIRLTSPVVQARMLNALIAEAAFLHIELGTSTRKEVERTLQTFLDGLPRP